MKTKHKPQSVGCVGTYERWATSLWGLTSGPTRSLNDRYTSAPRHYSWFTNWTAMCQPRSRIGVWNHRVRYLKKEMSKSQVGRNHEIFLGWFRQICREPAPVTGHSILHVSTVRASIVGKVTFSSQRIDASCKRAVSRVGGGISSGHRWRPEVIAHSGDPCQEIRLQWGDSLLCRGTDLSLSSCRQW